ncbi:MAG: hypothetical protein DELT_00100 [Desulfovibrio sp.]
MSSTYDSAMVTATVNTTKETVGAQIVTQTLDTLNKTAPNKSKSKTGANMAASYDFNKSVLSAAYNPTGTITELET